MEGDRTIINRSSWPSIKQSKTYVTYVLTEDLLFAYLNPDF